MSSNKSLAQLRQHHNDRVVHKHMQIYKARVGEVVAVPGRLRKRNAFNCSCFRCRLWGNPRRQWGLITVAELKADEAWECNMKEMDHGVGEGIGCEEIGSQDIGTGAGREEDWV